MKPSVGTKRKAKKPGSKRRSMKICIGTYVYELVWVEDKVLLARGCYAEADFRARQIRLAAVDDPARSTENLIHEVLEVINEQYCLSLPHVKLTVLGVALAQGLAPIIDDWC